MKRGKIIMAKVEKKVFELTKDYTSASGEKYVFQKVAPAEWLDILDDVDGEGKKGKNKRLYAAALEHVIVQPKKELNDFDDFAEVDEVVTAAVRFQQGK